MPPSPIAVARAIRRSERAPSARTMFLDGFLRHPGMIGSIIPSSRYLIDAMLAPIDWGSVRTFVEYGPGVGPFCRPILERLSTDARYVAIDANPDFVRYLRRTVHDPRLDIVHGSAAEVERILVDRGLERADQVLSGIPFSTLPPGIGERIVAVTHNILAPGGAMMIYQFSSRVRRLLDPAFKRIDTAIAWRSLPPARLFWAWKEAQA